jgi:uncharacterized protein (TIGR04168 family)
MQGGPSWDSVADFYRYMYDCQDVPIGNAAVLVAHNGPTGMGEDQHAPCGADFLPYGGDWGDPDTERALEELKQQRRCISHSLRTCEPG